MLSAGIKKEMMFFSRTKRMLAVTLVFLLLAAFDPILMKVTASLLDSYGSAITGTAEDERNAPAVVEKTVSLSSAQDEWPGAEPGSDFFSQNVPDGFEEFEKEFEDIYGDTQDIPGVGGAPLPEAESEPSPDETAFGGAVSMFGSVGYGFYASLTDITGTAMLVMILILMSTAGGEQKKRSVIIPNCSGLTPTGYVMPKFIFYPIYSGVITFAGGMLGYFVSALVNQAVMNIGAVCAACGFCALYMAFITVFMLALGLSTGLAGMSVAVTYVGASIIPLILSGFHADKFNPFSLKDFAATLAMGGDFSELDRTDVFVSIGVTVCLIAILIFVTLFSLTAKLIDNRDEELATDNTK